MITEDERFIKIQGILSFSDIHPEDCIKINDLIIELSKENQQLKEQVEYLRRSCERKEDTIISLQQDLTIIDELEKWCKSFTTEEFNYNFLVVRIKDILDKISELKGEKNEW